MNVSPTATDVLLDLTNVEVTYTRSGVLGRSSGTVAVDRVTFSVGVGESVGLVGESGCGKTSLGKAIVRLVRPASGSVRFNGTDVATTPQRRLDWYRREVQMVFQDSASALNPRYSVGESIAEPIRVHRAHPDPNARVAELLGMVGLSASVANSYPHELSGGQLQRVGIARALAVSPSLLVCDEPTASLDLSVQAQVLNLLADLKDELGLATVFISHNLPAVASFADRIIVMYMGRIVEVFTPSLDGLTVVHPYSVLLIESVPTLEVGAGHDTSRELRRDPQLGGGQLEGCRFVDRCPLYRALGEPATCREVEPELEPSPGQTDGLVRCHFAKESMALAADA